MNILQQSRTGPVPCAGEWCLCPPSLSWNLERGPWHSACPPQGPPAAEAATCHLRPVGAWGSEQQRGLLERGGLEGDAVERAVDLGCLGGLAVTPSPATIKEESGSRTGGGGVGFSWAGRGVGLSWAGIGGL